MTEERSYEMLFGITLAIFAAILAINDLGGGWLLLTENHKNCGKF